MNQVIVEREKKGVQYSVILLIVSVALFAFVLANGYLENNLDERAFNLGYLGGLVVFAVFCLLYLAIFRVEITDKQVCIRTMFKKRQINFCDVKKYVTYRLPAENFAVFGLFADAKPVSVRTTHADEFEKILQSNNVPCQSLAHPDEQWLPKLQKRKKIFGRTASLSLLLSLAFVVTFFVCIYNEKFSSATAFMLLFLCSLIVFFLLFGLKRRYARCEKIIVDAQEQEEAVKEAKENLRLTVNCEPDSLVGCKFKKTKFVSTETSNCERCIFCRKAITAMDVEDEHTDVGYVTFCGDAQQTLWVCEDCFNDLKDEFEFVEEDPS